MIPSAMAGGFLNTDVEEQVDTAEIFDQFDRLEQPDVGPIFEIYPKIEQFTRWQASELLHTAFLAKPTEELDAVDCNDGFEKPDNELLLVATNGGKQILLQLEPSIHSAGIRLALLAATNVNLPIDPMLLQHPAIRILTDNTSANDQPSWVSDLVRDGQSIEETAEGMIYRQRDLVQPGLVAEYDLPIIATPGDSDDSEGPSNADVISDPAAETGSEPPNKEIVRTGEVTTKTHNLRLRRRENGEPDLFYLQEDLKSGDWFHWAGCEQERVEVIKSLLGTGHHLVKEMNDPAKPPRETEFDRVGAVSDIDTEDGIAITLRATMGLKPEEPIKVEPVDPTIEGGRDGSDDSDQEQAGGISADKIEAKAGKIETIVSPETTTRKYPLVLRYDKSGQPNLFRHSDEAFDWTGVGNRDEVIAALQNGDRHMSEYIGPDGRKQFQALYLGKGGDLKSGIPAIFEIARENKQIDPIEIGTAESDTDDNDDEQSSLEANAIPNDSDESPGDPSDHSANEPSMEESSSSDDDTTTDESEPALLETTDSDSGQEEAVETLEIVLPQALDPSTALQIIIPSDDQSAVYSDYIIGTALTIRRDNANPDASARHIEPHVQPTIATQPAQSTYPNHSVHEISPNPSLQKRGMTGYPLLSKRRVGEDFWSELVVPSNGLSPATTEITYGEKGIPLDINPEPEPKTPMTRPVKKPDQPPAPGDHLVPQSFQHSDGTITQNTHVETFTAITKTADATVNDSEQEVVAAQPTETVVKNVAKQSAPSRSRAQVAQEKSMAEHTSTQQSIVVKRSNQVATKAEQTMVQHKLQNQEKVTEGKVETVATQQNTNSQTTKIETKQRLSIASTKSSAQASAATTAKTVSVHTKNKSQEKTQKEYKRPDKQEKSDVVKIASYERVQSGRNTTEPANTTHWQQQKRETIHSRATEQRATYAAEVAERNRAPLQKRSPSAEQRQRRQAQTRTARALEAEIPLGTRDTAQDVIQQALLEMTQRSEFEGSAIGLRTFYHSVGRIIPKNILRFSQTIRDLSPFPADVHVHDEKVVVELRDSDIATTQQFTQIASQHGQMSNNKLILALAA